MQPGRPSFLKHPLSEVLSYKGNPPANAKLPFRHLQDCRFPADFALEILRSAFSLPPPESARNVLTSTSAFELPPLPPEQNSTKPGAIRVISLRPAPMSSSCVNG